MKSAPNIGGTRRVGSYSYGPTAGQQGSSSSREDPLAEAVRLNNAHNVVNRIDGVPVITRWRILSQVDRRLMQPQHQIGDADDSRRSVRHKFRIMDISDVDGMPLLPSKIPPHFSSCHSAARGRREQDTHFCRRGRQPTRSPSPAGWRL